MHDASSLGHPVGRADKQAAYAPLSPIDPQLRRRRSTSAVESEKSQKNARWEGPPGEFSAGTAAPAACGENGEHAAIPNNIFALRFHTDTRQRAQRIAVAE